MKHKKTLLALVASILILEFLLQALGVTDFPIYEYNNTIGYIPKPSQEGVFLNKNHWKFNSISMGANEFSPSPQKTDTLLIGDSIVLGGNPVDQADRLGPQISNITNESVWPISAGSWALQNELTYIREHKEVFNGIDNFIFILNSGDFGQPSSWSCNTTHPTYRPKSAIFHLISKYALSLEDCKNILPENKVQPRDWRNDWIAFSKAASDNNKKVSVFLYPDKNEVTNKKMATEKNSTILTTDGKIAIYSIIKDSRWKAEYYKDEIHPTNNAIKILADIITHPQTEDEIKFTK